jgi:prolyl oligopeptidase
VTNHLDALEEFKKNHPPEVAHKTRRALGLHGHVVSGAYLHLEVEDVAKTKEWVAAQNERTQAFCQVKSERQQASAPTPSRPYISDVNEVAGKKFAKYFDEAKKRYCLLRYDADKKSHTLFDTLQVDPSGQTALVDYHPSPDGNYAICVLTKDGNDVGSARVIDLNTGECVTPEIKKFHADSTEMLRWDADGKGFLYSAWSRDDKRYVAYHRDMTSPSADDTIAFAPPEKNGFLRFSRVSEAASGKKSPRVYAKTTFGTQERNGLYVRDEQSETGLRELFNDGASIFEPIMEDNGKLIAYTTYNAPRGRIVSMDMADPSPDRWREVVPQKADALSEVFAHKGLICAHYMHNTASKVELYHPNGKRHSQLPLAHMAGVYFPPKQDDKVLAWYESSFESGGNWRYYDADSKKIKRELAPEYQLKNVVVEQLWATSKDGTKVPMTVVRGKKTALDGSAATLMTGYGGFNVPRTPELNKTAYEWVSQGGIYVQTNLRGGGEFGQEWYDGGRLENKQNVFDDFAACAEHLIKKNCAVGHHRW